MFRELLPDLHRERRDGVVGEVLWKLQLLRRSDSLDVFELTLQIAFVARGALGLNSSFGVELGQLGPELAKRVITDLWPPKQRHQQSWRAKRRCSKLGQLLVHRTARGNLCFERCDGCSDRAALL